MPASSRRKRPSPSRKAPAARSAVAKPVVASASLPRVAKGKRPQYFSDPAIDKLLWITLTLCEELSVTRDRLDTVERLLDKRKVVKRIDIDHYRPDAAAAAERSKRRTAYIDRFMRAVQAELEEIAGRGAKAVDEAQAAVSS